VADDLPSVRQESNPLKFFAVFTTIAWNFRGLLFAASGAENIL